ncbi:MAG: hypothetical protein ACLFPJ_00175 [Candidatus Woesearchaeota archaeon]
MFILNFIEKFPYLEFFYTALIIFICLLIYIKIKKAYFFSKHIGLKYFYNAFLFFAIAFSFRFIYFLSNNFKEYYLFELILYNGYILILFEFFFLLPGFYFLMSFIYKHIKNYEFILWTLFILIFFMVSLIDYYYHTFFLMYILNIIIFLLNTIICFFNYLKKRAKYSKFYFIAMFLLLISWSINFSTQYLLDQLPFLRYYTYAINLFALFIIYYIVYKILKDF